MIAAELISNVVPVLKRGDSCLQALNWMELFRVSHLPLVQGKSYLGLVADELIYAHADFNDPVEVLKIPVEDTYVYGDCHIYDVIGMASIRLLSVVPVVDRKEHCFIGSVTITDLLKGLDHLLCAEQPGGIIVLEISRVDYTLTEVVQIVEYNEAHVLSCYTSCDKNPNQFRLTLKVDTLNIMPILDTFIRYGYTIKGSFVTGEEEQDSLRERYGLLMKYLAM